jgi:hypothetical protein
LGYNNFLSNFYLEFLIDLNRNRSEFDFELAQKILNAPCQHLTSGFDILLRHCNPQDRINLINLICELTDNETDISTFYRWNIPNSAIVKTLEIRASINKDSKIITGVIIDQTCNSKMIFPELSIKELSDIRNEIYLLFDFDLKIKAGDNVHIDEETLDEILNAINELKKDLSIIKYDPKFVIYKISPDSIEYSSRNNETYLCVLSTDGGELYSPNINNISLRQELENLLEKFRI